MQERFSRIRRRKIKSVAAMVTSGIFIFILLVLLVLGDYSYNEDKWNNGYCSCGGEWYFKAVESSHASTANSKYWYECDECRSLMYQTRAR